MVQLPKTTRTSAVPSGNLLEFAIENGPVEIVIFPMKLHGGSFQSVMSFPLMAIEIVIFQLIAWWNFSSYVIRLFFRNETANSSRRLSIDNP